MPSNSQLARDINALRGLWVRQPKARTMQDLLLAAGEEIQPAVRQMVKDGELMTFVHEGQVYYDLTEKLRPYRLT